MLYSFHLNTSTSVPKSMAQSSKSRCYTTGHSKSVGTKAISMQKSRSAWYHFRLLSLFLAMTTVCLVSWAYNNRCYLVKDTRLVMQKLGRPTNKVSLEETITLDWQQLYTDGITLLLILVGLAAVAIWLNIQIKRCHS